VTNQQKSIVKSLADVLVSLRRLITIRAVLSTFAPLATASGKAQTQTKPHKAMKIRIATYNVNNLFRRANVFELQGMNPQAAQILADIAQLEGLLSQASYAGATGNQIVALLNKYEYDSVTGKPKENPWFFVNEVRQKLYRKDNGASSVVLVAKGRNDWLGWIELKRDTTNAEALANTGRVVQKVKPDVLCLVEVEDRLAMDRFNGRVLRPAGVAFDHDLLVDGNDPRGIDLGLYSQFPIRSVRSHIDEPDPVTKPFPLFSRDCPEYEVELGGGKTLWMLCNHFKSKLGSPTTSNAKRKRQADKVKSLLNRFNLATDHVVVCGDLNDTPNSAPLTNLLSKPKLHDVLASPLLNGPRWTYQDGKDQIDYLLVSEALHNKLTAVGIERRGIFHKTSFNNQFPHFPQVKDKVTQASDHAAVWADFNL
jgi:endonuclease/exonuclease/phosphatase family metal-dependent hydrolase